MTLTSLAALVVLSFLYFDELGGPAIVIYWVAYIVGLFVLVHLLHASVLGVLYAWLVVLFALFKATTGGPGMRR